MKIAIASDHAGFELKEKIKNYLSENGNQVEDFGCNSEERVDYPDYIKLAAIAVSQGNAERAVLVCGSGVGASIVGNKIPGIRAVLCFNEYIAEYSRLHNNSNALALAGRLVTFECAKRFVDIWLKTPYEGGRHQNRLDKITELEKEYSVSDN